MRKNKQTSVTRRSSVDFSLTTRHKHTTHTHHAHTCTHAQTHTFPLTITRLTNGTFTKLSSKVDVALANATVTNTVRVVTVKRARIQITCHEKKRMNIHVLIIHKFIVNRTSEFDVPAKVVNH